MSALRRHQRIARAALLAASFGLAAAHAPAFATPDLTIVPVTCVPDRPDSLSTVIKSKDAGTAAMLGPNPPPHRMLFCPVNAIDDLATPTPTWRFLRLQYRDFNPAGTGRIVARSYAKSRKTGLVTPVAGVASVPSAIVNTVSTALPPKGLSFADFAYYVTVELNTQAAQIEAHMAMLTN